MKMPEESQIRRYLVDMELRLLDNWLDEEILTANDANKVQELILEPISESQRQLKIAFLQA